MAKNTIFPLLGIVPQLIYQSQQKKKKPEEQSTPKASTPSNPSGMVRGGRVTRGDGAAMRGKTKGRMC